MLLLLSLQWVGLLLQQQPALPLDDARTNRCVRCVFHGGGRAWPGRCWPGRPAPATQTAVFLLISSSVAAASEPAVCRLQRGEGQKAPQSHLFAECLPHHGRFHFSAAPLPGPRRQHNKKNPREIAEVRTSSFACLCLFK
jgi:hypothetical protein